MARHDRRSIRLKGYDYTQPNRYFVTVCANDRVCIFGEVINGTMKLSRVGKIALECWGSIPKHFPNARVDICQVMPNHVHGILEIRWRINSAETEKKQLPENLEKREPCRDVACNVPTRDFPVAIVASVSEPWTNLIDYQRPILT